jgi:uncharacterized protein (UPF0210 family)
MEIQNPALRIAKPLANIEKMTKHLILILVFINISCNQNKEKIITESKNELVEVQTKEIVKPENNLEKANDSLNVQNTSDTINLNNINTQDKVEVITNICTINGKIKFTHDLLGAPYVEGGNNGPSFTELVKNATSEESYYKIELYLNGKLKHERITNYKNNFRYQFKVKKNSVYKVKLYYKNSIKDEFNEVTSGNFQQDYLKTKDKPKIKWDIYRIFFTV